MLNNKIVSGIINTDNNAKNESIWSFKRYGVVWEFFIFLFTIIFTIASIRFLPDYLGALVGLMVFLLLLLVYVFGRVAMQVSIGKLIQRRFLGERAHSDVIAILLGVLVWTTLLSIPYLWTLALLALFAGGVGLVISARSKTAWQRE